ncbi:MAG: SH3 domain-containing protein [Pseudomonadota bacterium]
MKPATFLLVCLITLALPTIAADGQGIVVRSATVHSDAKSTASRIGQLPAGSKVSIFSRKGGWKEVFSDDKGLIGWVRSYQVREGDFTSETTVETQSDSRGFLSGLAAFSRKASGFFKYWGRHH